MGGNLAYEQGYSGEGQTVAVIDTGVRTDHVFFSNKIVSEACFSGSGGGTSLCPNGASSSFSVGSGNDCPLTIDGCGHGTHVAGIAVGNSGQLNGVAKDSNLIAIKTATQVYDNNGNSFITHYNTDIANALLRVDDLRNQFAISSVNMSIQNTGQLYSGTCDNLNSLVTDAINQLRSHEIATVIASGNTSLKNGMTFPACISSAISVGNTISTTAPLYYTAEPGVPYYTDDVAIDSNIGAETDLLAPGSRIISSYSSNSTATADLSGTSQAAPHVAGAFAILRSKNNTLSVDSMLTALKNSGTSVFDQRAGGIYTISRIDVGNALTLISNGNTTFQGLTPNGTTTGIRPTFTWTPLPGQTDYWVIADNTSLDWPYVVYQTISATAANCASGTCSYTSPVDFAPGAAVWKVQAPQSSGTWPETSLLNFTVN